MTSRLLLVLLGAALFSTGPDAQTRSQGTRTGPLLDTTGVRIPLRGTPIFAHLDLDSGTTSPMSRATASACFDNTIDLELADGLLYPASSEMFDWGVKQCGGSMLVDQIKIGYASQAVPTSLGGPGGSLIIRAYAGATGFGAFGTLIAEIKLTGLNSRGLVPGGPIGGGFEPHYLLINLGREAFFLPDGPIGWSYENTDGLTAAVLVDVDASLGTELAYDVYSPGPASAASYVGAFRLPAGPKSWDPKENSFYLQVYQRDVPAQAVNILAGGNPDILRTGVPVVGSSWVAGVDLSGVASTGVSLFAMSLTRGAGVQRSFGEMIIEPATLARGIAVGSTGLFRHLLPIDADLVGLTFYAQGGFMTPAGGLQLTNGMELTIGSY